MRNLLAVVGLLVSIEGLLFAGFPGPMQRALAAVATREPGRLRIIGLVSAVLGVAIVWLARRSGILE
jgi:uncharacterized protein YjeT (DUF2065 family)